MGISGKYKFSGISKASAALIRGALLKSPFAWIVKMPFFNALLEVVLNWAANKGLVVLNLGAYKATNYLDGKQLADAITSGWEAVESGRVLTEAEKKRIDDEVIKAADRALPYGRKPT